VQELKYQELVKWAETFEVGPASLADGPLKPYGTFKTNAHRLVNLVVMPPLLITHTGKLQASIDLAKLSVFGKLDGTPTNEQALEIGTQAAQILATRKSGSISGLGSLQSGAMNIDMWTVRDATLKEILGVLLSLALVNAWTVFETLATDLWVAALNTKPDLACAASMTAIRVDKNERDNAVDNELGKTIPIAKARDYDFDLRTHMGTILKASKRYKFDRLHGIVSAYRAAFGHKAAALFDKPSHSRLTVLEGIRNVLVHSAGKIDTRFKDRSNLASAAYGSLASLELGDDLPIEGVMTAEFLALSFNVCAELLELVNDAVGGKNSA
jgi:hypothetical protein